MKPSSKLWPRPALGRCLFVLGALYLSSGSATQAQNIDEGKSAQRLYTDSCATCHRNPSALAKGRIRPALFSFLQDHYTTGAGEAWALAGYLASVDAPPARSRSAKQKNSKPAPAPSTQPN